jgi:hypothetical protein
MKSLGCSAYNSFYNKNLEALIARMDGSLQALEMLEKYGAI